MKIRSVPVGTDLGSAASSSVRTTRGWRALLLFASLDAILACGRAFSVTIDTISYEGQKGPQKAHEQHSLCVGEKGKTHWKRMRRHRKCRLLQLLSKDPVFFYFIFFPPFPRENRKYPESGGCCGVRSHHSDVALLAPLSTSSRLLNREKGMALLNRNTAPPVVLQYQY